MKAADAVGDYLLTREEVLEVLSIGRSALYRGIKDGSFPQPISITPGTSRWPASAIREVMEAAKKRAGYNNND